MTNANGSIKLIQQAARALDVPLPKAVTAAIADAEKAIDNAGMITGSDGEVASVTFAALAAGRDPRTDPDVTAAIVGRELARLNLASVGRSQGAERVANVLRDHADPIITAWAKVVNKSGVKLSAAAEILPDDLEDAPAILKMGPKASQAYADATEALRIIRAGFDGWRIVAQLCGQSSGDRAKDLLVLADVDPQYAELLRADAIKDIAALAWRLVRDGHTIALPTIAEYRTRVTGVVEQRQQNTADSGLELAGSVRF